MLKLFDKYYRRSDPKMMSHIAQVLQSFNGGVSCIQIYVNQHDFFINRVRADPNIDSQLYVMQCVAFESSHRFLVDRSQ